MSANRGNTSAKLSTLSEGAKRTPRRPDRASQASVSFRSSASGTITGSASVTSSPKRRHSSARTSCRFRMRRIGALLERLDAYPMDHVHESLAVVPLGAIDLHDPLDGCRNFVLRHRRPDHLAERGKAVHRAAQRNLVPLLAVLIDAQDADVPDVMMSAGVHTARHLDLDIAEVVEVVE